MTNKRIYTVAPCKSIIEDCPMPELPDDGVLIRNTMVGICMSEHYGWSHAEKSLGFGHEPLGVIEAVGKDYKGELKVGDVVSGRWGNPLPGGGGMVQYTVPNFKTANIVKLSDKVREVDQILEPLACMISAVSKAKCNIPGMDVCVVGAGYMGCGAISLLKLRGCFVTAVDIRPESRENAKKYGADTVFSAEEAEAMLAVGLKGFDVVMEWGETNESLDLAIKMTRQCGQLAIGAYHTGGKRTVDIQQLNVKAIDCLSTHPREHELNLLSCKSAIRMLDDGSWCFRNVPTKVYPISRFDEAQAELSTKFGKYLKAMVSFSDEEFEPYIIK